MADIRINALATTAASTASDDFVAVDGSANGTRKLNAFSPTFGGNLTVSGTGTISGYVTSVEGFVTTAASANTTQSRLYLDSPAGQTGAVARILKGGSDLFSLSSAGTATLAGNLTVSGTGTSSFGGTVSAAGYGSFGADSGLVDGVLQIKRSTTARTSQIQFQTAGSNDYQLYTSGASSPLYISIAGSATHAFAANGNLLIGKTTPDSGQKLQVSGSTFTTQNYYSGASNTGLFFTGVNDDYTYGVWRDGSNNIKVTTNNVTALTLDSSQNATFAGSRITLGGSGNGEVDIRRATNSNGSSVSYRTTSTLKWYHGLRGLVNDNWYLQNEVAGNTALFFDAATSDATFAGKVTVQGTTMTLSGSTFGIDMGAKGSANNPFFDFNSSGNNNDFDVRLQAKGGGAGSALGTLTLHATTVATASNAGAFIIGDSGTSTPTSGTAVAIGGGKIFTGSDVTVGGAIAIGNTVNTVSPTSPNRTITMVIGGTTYYIHAKTTND